MFHRCIFALLIAALAFSLSASGAISQGSLVASSTALVASPSPSTFGEAVTLTATVTPNTVVPTGNVTFFDGATSLGSGALNGSGVATLVTSALGAGAHSLTASYVGDANYLGSTAAAFALTVNKASQVPLAAVASPSTISIGGTSILSTTGGSGTGAVTFAVTAGQSNCSISGTLLSAFGFNPIGCLLTATKAADANYNAATATVVVTVRERTAFECTDHFADAFALSGTNGAVAGWTGSATGEAGEPDHAGVSAPLNSVWCKWAAPLSGQVSFNTTGSVLVNTTGSLYDTTLAVYTGASLGALTPVASNDNISGADNRSRVTFNATQGVTYYIAIDGVGAATGNYVLSWSLVESASAATFAAVLPYARSITTGQTATAFGTIINAGNTTASQCSVAQPPGFPATFSYQATNAANQPSGSPNTPVDIAPGAAQSYVFALTPTRHMASTDVGIVFDCANTPVTTQVSGLNTFLLSATLVPSPDMVAIGATPTGDGIVNLPGASGTGFFATAAVNIGTAGSLIASVDDNGRNLPLTVALCQTNPSTGACINPATPAGTANLSIGANETVTFAIFVTGTGNFPFDPANNRLFMRLKTADGVTRGATSVAVRTTASAFTAGTHQQAAVP